MPLNIHKTEIEKLTKNLMNIMAISTYIAYIFIMYMSLQKDYSLFVSGLNILFANLCFLVFFYRGILMKNSVILSNIYFLQIYICFYSILSLFDGQGSIYNTCAVATILINIFQYFYTQNRLKIFINYFTSFYFKKLGGDFKIQMAYKKYMHLIVARDYFIFLYISNYIQLTRFLMVGSILINVRALIIMFFMYHLNNFMKKIKKTDLKISLGLLSLEFLLALFTSTIYYFQSADMFAIKNIFRVIFISLFQLYLIYKMYGVRDIIGTGLRRKLRKNH